MAKDNIVIITDQSQIISVFAELNSLDKQREVISRIKTEFGEDSVDVDPLIKMDLNFRIEKVLTWRESDEALESLIVGLIRKVSGSEVFIHIDFEKF